MVFPEAKGATSFQVNVLPAPSGGRASLLVQEIASQIRAVIACAQMPI